MTIPLAHPNERRQRHASSGVCREDEKNALTLGLMHRASSRARFYSLAYEENGPGAGFIQDRCKNVIEAGLGTGVTTWQ
jgi:hypothetical protein